MPTQTSPMILRSQPGIKRDGTKFDGEFYTDGQWVRFQRGLPRKIGGYRSVSKYLTEISRGITDYTQNGLVYYESGGVSTLERFTTDAQKNSSLITDRTPQLLYATATVTLTGGGSGAVNFISVNGVTITGGIVPFNTNLTTTAADVAASINSTSTSPDYTAVAVGPTITITSATGGQAVNGFVVVVDATTITATHTNMSGGQDALPVSPYNKWMFDYMFDSSTVENSVIAHVAPNNRCICSDDGGRIYIGSVAGTDPVTEIFLPEGANVTGGIVVLHPYLFYYGSAGIIGWSVAGEPANLTGAGSGTARVWGQKIIKGLPLRAGSGSAPAGIFWAYDAVIRATFSGGSTVFQFDTIATDTSILSPDCVIDYDGVFYWAGVDRFMMFNGVVREVPNSLNINYFYDGLNQAQKAKVFAFKVPRYGEIWWCYPRGEATECTHAVIYNVRENTWYDTELPNDGRSAAVYANAYACPVTTGVRQSGSGYKVWFQEQGVNEISGQNMQPIASWFETADMSAVAAKGTNTALRVERIEPDFVQVGDMTVQVTGRANARAPEVYSSQFKIVDPANVNEPFEQIVMLKEQRRELRFKFMSNEVNGDYQMGQILGHVGTGDGTVLG